MRFASAMILKLKIFAASALRCGLIQRRSKSKTPRIRRAAQRMLFSLGMVELISYWKCACPPRVVVECGGLDEADNAFWKRLYFNGLGEFFFRNGIEADYDTFLTLEAPAAEPFPTSRFATVISI